MSLRTRDHHASRDHTFKMLFGGLWCGTCLHEVPRPAGRLHMRVKAALVDHPHERGRLLPDLLSHLRRADIPMIAERVLSLFSAIPQNPVHCLGIYFSVWLLCLGRLQPTG